MWEERSERGMGMHDNNRARGKPLSSMMEASMKDGELVENIVSVVNKATADRSVCDLGGGSRDGVRAAEIGPRSEEVLGAEQGEIMRDRKPCCWWPAYVRREYTGADRKSTRQI